MLKTCIFAALALLPTQASSLTMQCNLYAGLQYPEIKLNEYINSYTVSWEGYTQSYNKTFAKRFGVLMDAGISGDGVTPVEEHLFRHDNISGERVIILDSMVFVPICGK